MNKTVTANDLRTLIKNYVSLYSKKGAYDQLKAAGIKSV
jgi:hypothetical protein